MITLLIMLYYMCFTQIGQAKDRSCRWTLRSWHIILINTFLVRILYAGRYLGSNPLCGIPISADTSNCSANEVAYQPVNLNHDFNFKLSSRWQHLIPVYSKPMMCILSTVYFIINCIRMVGQCLRTGTI